jgi:WD40 repeat protein/predicted Ser/Thr protein kinase
MVWNPGQHLFGSRYIIERKLGEGGIGITYLAQNRSGELRVIKTLREQILNHPDWIPHQDKLRQDFRDEALRLSLCRHPHIVQVENVFDEDNLPCMAMEYIEGEDLGKLITKKGALSEGEALQYIRQIGDALILVHEKGLLHRDLKPSNIMMRAGKPEAVLIDFGLARQFISGTVQQHTQSLTPGYAPPEQYAPIEQRGEYIDVYAFAATLYSLVTGQLPMPAPARLQNFTLQAPKELNGNVSDRVNEAIMKGMALNYKLRPQSVQEWLDLLGASPIPPTQPVISRLNTSTSWECVHDILRISIRWGLYRTITFSPKEDILAIVAGSVVHLLLPTTGQLIRTLSGHSSSVESIAISGDGQILASGCWDHTIKLWSLPTGREIRTLTGHSSYVNSVAISSDGQILTSVSGDNTIKLWSVTTGREIHTLTGHDNRVTSVAISSDGQILAIGHEDKTIKLWSVTTGREIRTLTGHSGGVTSVAISSNREILASSSWDKTIKLWSMTTGKEIRTFTGHPDGVTSVAISSDGQILASSGGDKTIKLWSMTTGKLIRTLTGHSDYIECVAISGDGQILASGSGDNTIKIWSIVTGEEIRTLAGYPVAVAGCNNGEMLVAEAIGSNMKLWSVKTGKEIRTFKNHSGLSAVAISTDGQMLASAGNGPFGPKIELWSVTQGKKIRILTGHSSLINSLVISSDQQFLASSSFDDNTIKIWDISRTWLLKTIRGKRITLSGHSDRVLSLAISTNGEILASGSSDKTIKLWSLTDGKEIRTLNGHSHAVYSVAFSSDGQILASGSVDGIKLWEVATSKEICTLIGHSSFVQSVAFSGDGQILASGSQDKTIKLWSIAIGKEICTLSHFDCVKSVSFTPDGNCLAAADSSGNIKIWRSQLVVQ